MTERLLDRIPSSSEVVTGEHRFAVAEQVAALRSPTDYTGATVALQGAASYLLKWLALLDGVVDQIVLLPSRMEPSLAASLMRDAGVDVLLSDRSHTVTVDDVPVCVEQDIAAPLPAFAGKHRRAHATGNQLRLQDGGNTRRGAREHSSASVQRTQPGLEQIALRCGRGKPPSSDVGRVSTSQTPNTVLKCDPAPCGSRACDSSDTCFATEWLLPTSGTTATPRLVSHTLASLTRTTRTDERCRGHRWGMLYDPARFAGLQVMLQAAISGAVLLIPPDGYSVIDQVRWFADRACTALSATPTLWRKLLMCENIGDVPLQQITVGGEIADESCLNALRRAFPAAHVTHIYASTEAGVGFAVHDGRPGFPASWLEQGAVYDGCDKPLSSNLGEVSTKQTPNTDIRLAKNHEVQGAQLRVDRTGCLWLKPRDAGPPAVNSSSSELAEAGWINSGDLVHVAGDRVLFRGRLNGSINVGGNKVMPEEVEAVVGEVPGVASTMVRGRQSSIMGSLVEAFVLPTANASTDLKHQIRSHCRQRLAAHQVPAFIHLVDHLDISAAGKIVRGHRNCSKSGMNSDG